MARQNLKNKKVILSGISSGIGKEIARILIEKYDCEVYGIARNEDKILNFKSELSKPQNLVGYSLFDVSIEQNWINLQNELKNTDFKAQIIINCAGFLPPFSKFEIVRLAISKRFCKQISSLAYTPPTIFCQF